MPRRRREVHVEVQLRALTPEQESKFEEALDSFLETFVRAEIDRLRSGEGTKQDGSTENAPAKVDLPAQD